MRRGALYSCCRGHGYNKLVLGHNLDDVAESFFLSTIHKGQLRTMRASYWNDSRDVCVVRPMVLVREHAIKAFSIEARLPIVNEYMPQVFEPPKERQRIKAMISREESLFPELFGSLRRALQPLLSGEEVSRRDSEKSRPPTSTSLGEEVVLRIKRTLRETLARLQQRFAALNRISAA